MSEKTEEKTIEERIKTPFLLPDEAAHYLRMDRRTLDNHRTNNTGPRYRKHGGRICYHKKDLKLWSGLNDCGSKIDHAQHV